MYRDLLVHVDGSSAGRRRVQFAITLARRMGARLSGIHVTPPPKSRSSSSQAESQGRLPRSL